MVEGIKFILKSKKYSKRLNPNNSGIIHISDSNL